MAVRSIEHKRLRNAEKYEKTELKQLVSGGGQMTTAFCPHPKMRNKQRELLTVYWKTWKTSGWGNEE
jgi:hypothetical protein